MLGLSTAPLRQSQVAPESGEVILLDGFEDSNSFGLSNRGLVLFLNFFAGCSSCTVPHQQIVNEGVFYSKECQLGHERGFEDPDGDWVVCGVYSLFVRIGYLFSCNCVACVVVMR